MPGPSRQYLEQEYFDTLQVLNEVIAESRGVDDAVYKEALARRKTLLRQHAQATWEKLDGRVEFYEKLIAALKAVVEKASGAEGVRIVRFLQPIIDTAKEYIP